MAMAKQKSILTKADLDLILEVMTLHFVTRNEFTQFKSDLFDKLDLIIKYTKSTNDNLLAAQSQTDKRLTRVEHTLNLPALV